MNLPKVQLSPQEMELVMNSDWILTKNQIIEKVRSLLEQLQSRQQDVLFQYSSRLPPEVIQPSPKISKGENYKGLPYLVLDQPRHFNKENIFAIRTLFWWGNFFSSTLHLSGSYKTLYEEKIIHAYPALQKNGYFFCTSLDPWQHDFTIKNYVQVNRLADHHFRGIVQDPPFIKLSKKIDLEEWDSAEEKLTEMFTFYIDLLQT